MKKVNLFSGRWKETKGRSELVSTCTNLIPYLVHNLKAIFHISNYLGLQVAIG